MTNAFAARVLRQETDAAIVARLATEEGWNWQLQHSDDGEPLSSAKAAKHCLVISDANVRWRRSIENDRQKRRKPVAQKVSVWASRANIRLCVLD